MTWWSKPDFCATVRSRELDSGDEVSVGDADLAGTRDYTGAQTPEDIRLTLNLWSPDV